MKKEYVFMLVASFIAGVFGSVVALLLIPWFKLPPDHIDLLVFTESAFGIGMTVIALIFSLVLFNQSREFDKSFREQRKEFDERFALQVKSFAEVLQKINPAAIEIIDPKK